MSKNKVLNVFGGKKNKNDLYILEEHIRESIRRCVAEKKVTENILPYEKIFMSPGDIFKLTDTIYEFALVTAPSNKYEKVISQYFYEIRNIITDILCNDRLKLKVSCGSNLTAYYTYKCCLIETGLDIDFKSFKNQFKTIIPVDSMSVHYDYGTKMYGLYVEGYHKDKLIKNNIPFKNAVKFTEYLEK